MHHADLRELQNAELEAVSGGACWQNLYVTPVGNKGMLIIGWESCGGYSLPTAQWFPN